MRIRALSAAAGALLLASCVTPTPKPAPPLPPPPSAPVETPPPADWRDLPLAAGDWRWSPGRAEFGVVGGAPLLALRCQAGTVTIAARGSLAPGAQARLAFTASDGAFGYPAGPGEGGMIVAQTSSGDPGLDKLAFSRGRFAVAAPEAGLQRTLLPVRPEIGRLIEDCRRGG
ncbi:MAG: hypothetical protein JOY99_11830 [Sphingomonadaceae bacterium]|nr:hypothetical protein [Sphingomonadaceae bacterium]